MQGTYINVFAIICGTILGTILGKKLPKSLSDSLIRSIGLIALSLGISWIAKYVPQSQHPLLFIISLVLGNFIGEVFQLDQKIHTLQAQSDNNKNDFITGVVTASLLFCIGTFSILGPINAALKQEYTLLYTNALLDGITSIIFATAYGFPFVIVAAILFTWQGSIYLLAHQLAPYMTNEMFTELQIIGGILILGTGLNILQITKIRTINMLPALLISFFYILIKN